ncbi:hypothetical protein [Lewinella sp. IMCC34191]|uniref:hypothetical protein n=1 Tax=Lewinella sp. IMCC34191 TaxID=2259172 RepID=UPI001E306E37|nr:hypothetical protein [Lewinella sp. IMCC34191]
MALRAVTRRPVYLASYGTTSPSDPEAVPEPEMEPDPDPDPEKVRVRYDFPEKGSDRHGGSSDGYCYRIVFAAGRLERTYEMVRQFLVEEGYGAVPVPEDVSELKRFRLPPKLRHQLSLFGEDGYVHNPLKILFPAKGGKRGALILELHDERAPGHLLRFHRR